MTRPAPDKTKPAKGVVSAPPGNASPTTRSKNRHKPVLLKEVLEALSPRKGGIYVDGTFGNGGYSRGILEAADCTVFGIDRDPGAAQTAAGLSEDFKGRLQFISGCFGDMDHLLEERGVHSVDGVALDLGVSSMQLDEAQRGFSFRFDGPLDMRMEGKDSSGPSAADLVNTLCEEDLANIIYKYGEERASRRIARTIVKARKDKPLERTGELADIVRSCLKKKKHDAIDPATRTFQALRIEVNDEMGELERGLSAAEKILAPRGRLAVVSFHSLEDRRVKTFLKERSGGKSHPSRHRPTLSEGPPPSFHLISKRAIRPDDTEMAENSRARSARMRVAERLDAPAFPSGIPALDPSAAAEPRGGRP